MRAWRSAEPPRLGRGASVGAWLLVVVGAIGAVTTAASGFNVSRATTRLVDGVVLVDADLELAFGEEALEALNSGVPLTVIVDLKVVEVRRYVWDKRIAKLEARNRLLSHALSDQYIVENLNSGASRAYRTLDAAVEALGMLESFPVLDAHLLEPDDRYQLMMRARLDIEALPAPLRPVAYLSSLWEQDSAWSTWPIVR